MNQTTDTEKMQSSSHLIALDGLRGIAINGNAPSFLQRGHYPGKLSHDWSNIDKNSTGWKLWR